MAGVLIKCCYPGKRLTDPILPCQKEAHYMVPFGNGLVPFCLYHAMHLQGVRPLEDVLYEWLEVEVPNEA